MSGLVPEGVRHAIEAKGLFGASTSFGLVTLVLLVVLLLERETLHAGRPDSERPAALAAAVPPLLVAVLLTLAARVLSFSH